MPHMPRIRRKPFLPLLSTLVLFLSVITGVFLVQRQQDLRSKAVEKAVIEKPITGTFLMFDFSYDSPEGWYPYLDEIAEIGTDTVVILGVGVISNCPNYVVDSPILDKGILRRFLEAAKSRGFLSM